MGANSIDDLVSILPSPENIDRIRAITRRSRIKGLLRGVSSAVFIETLLHAAPALPCVYHSMNQSSGPLHSIVGSCLGERRFSNLEEMGLAATVAVLSALNFEATRNTVFSGGIWPQEFKETSPDLGAVPYAGKEEEQKSKGTGDAILSHPLTHLTAINAWLYINTHASPPKNFMGHYIEPLKIAAESNFSPAVMSEQAHMFLNHEINYLVLAATVSGLYLSLRGVRSSFKALLQPRHAGYIASNLPASIVMFPLRRLGWHSPYARLCHSLYENTGNVHLLLGEAYGLLAQGKFEDALMRYDAAGTVIEQQGIDKVWDIPGDIVTHIYTDYAAIAKDPEELWPYIDLAMVAMARHDAGMSGKILECAALQYKDSEDVLAYLARLGHAIGLPEESRRIWAKAIAKMDAQREGYVSLDGKEHVTVYDTSKYLEGLVVRKEVPKDSGKGEADATELAFRLLRQDAALRKGRKAATIATEEMLAILPGDSHDLLVKRRADSRSFAAEYRSLGRNRAWYMARLSSSLDALATLHGLTDLAREQRDSGLIFAVEDASGMHEFSFSEFDYSASLDRRLIARVGENGIADELRQSFKEMLAASLPGQGHAHFMHGDAYITNIRLDRRTGEAIIIDYGKAGMGHQHSDLAQLLAESRKHEAEEGLKQYAGSRAKISRGTESEAGDLRTLQLFFIVSDALRTGSYSGEGRMNDAREYLDRALHPYWISGNEVFIPGFRAFADALAGYLADSLMQMKL